MGPCSVGRAGLEPASNGLRKCRSQQCRSLLVSPFVLTDLVAEARRLLGVTQDDDDGVIRVDDDPIRRTAPLGVLSGAVVGVVTALPSG